MKKLLTLLVCFGSCIQSSGFAETPLLIDECDDGREQEEKEESLTVTR